MKVKSAGEIGGWVMRNNGGDKGEMDLPSREDLEF